MANEIGFSRVSPDITYNYIYVGDQILLGGLLKINGDRRRTGYLEGFLLGASPSPAIHHYPVCLSIFMDCRSIVT